MKRTLTVLLSLVLVACMLVACAAPAPETAPAPAAEAAASEPADEAAATEEAAPADAAAPAASGELTHSIFALARSVEVLEDSPFRVPEVMGYYAEEGLEMEFLEAFGSTGIKMVATGQADFTSVSPSLILTSLEAGVPVKSVIQDCGYQIFGMAVRTDSGIDTWEDMKGKTCALGDASWQLLAAPVLAGAGLDYENDIEWVVCGENRYNMVQEGKLDLLFTWLGECYQLIAQGFDFKYFDGGEVYSGCSNPTVSGLAQIAEHPEVVGGHVRAMQKGMYFTYYAPEASADIMSNMFPNIDVDWNGALAIQEGRIAQCFGLSDESRAFLLEKIGWHYEDSWRLNVESAMELGIINYDIDTSEIFTNEFIDVDFDRAAVEKDADNYVFQVKDKLMAKNAA